MGADATRLEITHTAVNVSRDFMESTVKKVKISLTFHRPFLFLWRLYITSDGVIFSESKSFEISEIRVMFTTGRLATTIFKLKYPLLPEKKSEKGPLLRLFSVVGGWGGGGAVHMLKLKVFR